PGICLEVVGLFGNEFVPEAIQAHPRGVWRLRCMRLPERVEVLEELACTPVNDCMVRERPGWWRVERGARMPIAEKFYHGGDVSRAGMFEIRIHRPIESHAHGLVVGRLGRGAHG